MDYFFQGNFQRFQLAIRFAGGGRELPQWNQTLPEQHGDLEKTIKQRGGSIHSGWLIHRRRVIVSISLRRCRAFVLVYG